MSLKNRTYSKKQYDIKILEIEPYYFVTKDGIDKDYNNKYDIAKDLDCTLSDISNYLTGQNVKKLKDIEIIKNKPYKFEHNNTIYNGSSIREISEITGVPMYKIYSLLKNFLL